MKLDRSYNLTIFWIDLSTNLDVRLVYELTKSQTKISNKIYEFKTYNETINNLIYKNIWDKAIDKKLRNLDSYQA